MRDVASGKETPLTKDGVKDFGYATDNAGWAKSDRAILLWSPDSKKIATFQQDQRQVGEMYLVSAQVGHPRLEAWKYPLPGDEHVALLHRVIIDVESGKVTRLKKGPDQHRSTLCDNIACRGGEWADVYWSPDSRKLAFVSTSRDHRRENLREADVATGEVSDILEEEVATFFESGNGAVNWRYLPASNEILWFSQRDNWGHLYLYDLQTRRLKNARRGKRHAGAARRREDPHHPLPRRRPREGAGSVLRPSLSRRLRRQESAAADTGRRHARSVAVAVGQVLHRQLLEA
jgi:hypothetical protein